MAMITQDQDQVRTKAELAVLSQIQTKLSIKHDLACLFPEIKPYFNTLLYTEGTHVSFEHTAYTALKDTQGTTPPFVWDHQIRYLVGDKVIFNAQVYNCIVETNPGDEPSNSAFFALESDPNWTLCTARDPYLLMIAVDLVLYHIHSSISPNNIPVLRKERYDEAMIFLEAAAKGEAALEACLKVDTQGNSETFISTGFSKRRSNHW